MSPTELRSRCDYVMKLASLISGSEEEEERELLFVQIMKTNFSFFQRALKQSGKNFFDNIISVKNAAELRLVLQMPTYMFRRLRNCLSTLGFPILPSEPKMRLYRLPLLKHADKGQIGAGVFLLRHTVKDSSVSPVPYLKVKDLAKYVNDVFTNLELQNKVSYTGFNDEIWILFSGDKGGSLMKFHFEIINGTSTGSIFNVHVFCLYEGADIPENMWQLFDSYRHVISEMLSDCYRINGKKG